MGDGINWFLTALFNPLFLLFILGFFFFGKLVGCMVSRPNVWKLLILCYFGVFLIEPLRNLGWVFGGSFLLGFFSGTIRNLPGILAWADGLGDIVFALKHRNAYEELKRQEERFEEELRRAREEAARANTGQSRQQQEWANEARQARGGKKRSGENEKDRGGGGRSHGGGSSSSGRVSGDGKQDDKRSQRRYNSSDTHGRGDGSTQSGEDKRARCLKILGLDPMRSYNPDELKAAYRTKVKKTHPDAGGSQAEFIEVVNAYEWLTI